MESRKATYLKKRVENMYARDEHRGHFQAPLKEESKTCLRNLAAYTPEHEHCNAYFCNPKFHMNFNLQTMRGRYGKKKPGTLNYPLSRCAAVLVGLFVGRKGDLYVVLSRRALSLRTFAGDTALPGGKYEEGDLTPEDTARREAFEEIGLPQDRNRIPHLCTLEPIVSSNRLIIFPVVVLITDPTIKPFLNTPEVAAIFSHPLRSFLSNTPPYAEKDAQLLDLADREDVDTSTNAREDGQEQAPPYHSFTKEYHTFEDYPWGPDDGRYCRTHKFRTGREPEFKPIYGLTALILLQVAMVGYGIAPEFEPNAVGEPSLRERLIYVMDHDESMKEACIREGVLLPLIVSRL